MYLPKRNNIRDQNKLMNKTKRLKSEFFILLKVYELVYTTVDSYIK